MNCSTSKAYLRKKHFHNEKRVLLKNLTEYVREKKTKMNELIQAKINLFTTSINSFNEFHRI